jgi:hypothetical protein
MSATVEYHVEIGNGQVQVFSRSALGTPFNVVVGRNLLGTADLYRILDVRAASVDGETAAIREHQQRGVS